MSRVRSIFVSMVVLALEIKTVRVGGKMYKGMSISGSKAGPSPVVREATHSAAVAGRWKRSEAATAVIERYIRRMAEGALGKSRALPFDRVMILRRVLPMISHVSSASTRVSEEHTPDVCATVVRGNHNGIYLIAGVVVGNFDATAGLIFGAARKSFQKCVQGEEAEKRGCHVSFLFLAIGGDGGLYCR